MFRKINQFVKHLDWFLLGPIIVLLCLSLAEIYSISLGQAGGDFLFFYKQLSFVVIGLGLYFFLAAWDFHHFYSYAIYFYLGVILLLIAVLIFGQTVNGTRGWFYIFGLGLQPVELMKMILLISLARYFAKVSVSGNPFKHFVVSGLLTALPIGLILLQPDAGSATLLFIIWIILIAAVGFEKKYFLAVLGGIVIISGLAWQFALQPYQRDRLTSFFRPSETTMHYNVKQSIIAIGAGGLYGRGLGFGSQSQLKFLPEAKTDFIFAVVAEELGFIGVLIVLGCFGLLIYRLLTLVPRVRNYFGSLILIGGVGLIFIEMFITIGMNVGILPVIGLPLPFLSYGGSALIAHLGLLGLIQNISSRSAAKR